MKPISTILMLLLFISATTYAQQIPRTILIEEFTNASCVPCASQNPAFNALLHDNADIAIPLKFQVWWPGYDPMYEQNSEQIDVRTPYYSISAVPTAVMNGRIPDNTNTTGGDWTGYPGGPYGFTQEVLDNEANKTTPFHVTLDHTISNDLDSIDIQLVIKNLDTVAFNAASDDLVAHIAITEELIDFPEPPGSTDQEDFPEVMRKMLPSVNGTALPQTWDPGDSMVIIIATVLPTYIYNYSEVAVVAFIQNADSKEVWQAAKSDADPSIADNYADGKLENSTNLPAHYCADKIEPSLTIENVSTLTITSVEVSAELEDGSTLSESWSGNLAQGESAQIDFGNGNLELGENNITFDILSVNGMRDVNRMNNIYGSESYVVRIPATEVNPVPHFMGFDQTSLGNLPEETYEDNPDDARMYVVNQGVHQDVTWPLGGFGNSSSCLRFDFYAMSPGMSASLILEKLDLSNQENSYLKFSYSYRQYSNEDDQLLIEASTDCGETWASVFDMSGVDLSTGPAVGTGRYYPNVSDWVADSIDISHLDGSEEVVFRITGVSDFGNSLYLDDFEVNNAIISGISNPDPQMVSVFPNPATNLLYLDLGEFSGEWNAYIYNAMGQEVRQDAIRGNANGVINIAELPNGYYLIKLKNGQRSATAKFVIER